MERMGERRKRRAMRAVMDAFTQVVWEGDRRREQILASMSSMSHVQKRRLRGLAFDEWAKRANEWALQKRLLARADVDLRRRRLQWGMDQFNYRATDAIKWYAKEARASALRLALLERRFWVRWHLYWGMRRLEALRIRNTVPPLWEAWHAYAIGIDSDPIVWTYRRTMQTWGAQTVQRMWRGRLGRRVGRKKLRMKLLRDHERDEAKLEGDRVNVASARIATLFYVQLARERVLELKRLRAREAAMAMGRCKRMQLEVRRIRENIEAVGGTAVDPERGVDTAKKKLLVAEAQLRHAQGNAADEANRMASFLAWRPGYEEARCEVVTAEASDEGNIEMLSPMDIADKCQEARDLVEQELDDKLFDLEEEAEEAQREVDRCEAAVKEGEDALVEAEERLFGARGTAAGKGWGVARTLEFQVCY
jgi:hypothetical protein